MVLLLLLLLDSLSPNRLLLCEGEVTVGSGLVDGDGAALHTDIEIFNPIFFIFIYC